MTPGQVITEVMAGATFEYLSTHGQRNQLSCGGKTFRILREGASKYTTITDRRQAFKLVETVLNNHGIWEIRS